MMVSHPESAPGHGRSQSLAGYLQERDSAFGKSRLHLNFD
jgi:hypothetical protein